MEEKEGLNGFGVTLKGDEAPQSYMIKPRVENTSQYGCGSTAQPLSEAAPENVAAPPTGMKKRGRPRKYAPDGSIVALSPMPISASIPLSGDFSAWKQSGVRKVNSFKKKNKLELGNPGAAMAYSVGGGFTPHVITVNAGEDVTMKIISFSQQGSRAICILAANGAVSNVTLRQPDSSGGTMTYEGHFELLSLTGSFTPNDNGFTKSRTGGMSVSLAGPDGRVLGGSLAGMLVASGSIQVVIGSFLPGHQLEQKPKKPNRENTIAFAPSPTNPMSQERYEVSFNGLNPNLTSPVSFLGNNLSSINSIQGSKITDIDNNDSLLGEDSGEQSHEITC
ncbi:AT-hook motif nuclear-localized protein 1-like [Primulina eburnea]|uniref:AT-hook motif nuclear-localized protein 1-like n=1 Tax=Primulina eburnea TaxID=1245227 RepID=UPI003C6C66A5